VSPHYDTAPVEKQLRHLNHGGPDWRCHLCGQAVDGEKDSTEFGFCTACGEDQFPKPGDCITTVPTGVGIATAMFPVVALLAVGVIAFVFMLAVLAGRSF
jgi:hypothetical protein